MKRNRWILAGLLVLLAAALYENYDKEIKSWFGSGESSATEAESGKSVSALVAENAPKPGTPAPEFSLAGLDGKTYEVGGKRDKPLLLNFWASWCDPCKEEAPDLVKLADKYGSQLDVYAVNVTFYDKLDNAKEFVENYGYTFPVLLDEKEKLYRMYNGIAFPTNVLIDENGKVQDVIVGTLSKEELEAKIKKLLNV
ncbi:thiol-disulfide isomerase/thioredoxin [Fontibacillus phaseoli]|uniref:Thiol-disulfide isomerase/thioredoxin n=1 Tax=Fontibacillus phaseoli TaxID=1416533 RepID=A0A369BM61_9BACL|nr:TlpA disulfide reductase family protein [Fontibacillus phaseoli]RCX21708.1 thiol-disulfide isomerase/thioredoxin [Fontibacillus phaseoli]